VDPGGDVVITREQVADLRPGDVVELTDQFLCTTRGPLRELGAGGALLLGAFAVVRYADGGSAGRADWSLTVTSRAPRPLYVNHDRTEPVPGDVVRDADSDDTRVWLFDGDAPERRPWYPSNDTHMCARDDLPTRLRLLVDGETGQVVP
jgi:hypothetical protein